MKNIKSCLLITAIVAFAFFVIHADDEFGCPDETPAGAVSLKVMTFNIRTISISDGLDYWSFRKDHVADLIKRHSPDIVGTQEVWTIQAKDLEKRLPDYEWFGTPRDIGKTGGEMCAVFYKKDRLELIEEGTFWMSENPDKPGSKDWDAVFPRVVTWGKFREIDSGNEFYFFNTHFAIVKQARKNSAPVLVSKFKEIAGDTPSVVLGDFNTVEGSDPYRTITSVLQDSKHLSFEGPKGPDGTSRGFKRDSKVGKRIDYIFVTPTVCVREYEVIDDTYGKNRRPSDHLPVTAVIEISK
jgi:endonuclease/exonuclease/phosphatase family metal-dependent hydrolase